MNRAILYLSLVVSFGFIKNHVKPENQLTKLQFHLSAFGVESDQFPNIYGIIDFEKDSSFFERSYYNPKYKTTYYRLTKKEMSDVHNLFNGIELDSIKGNSKLTRTDQPTSYLKLHTKSKIISVEDYDLEGTQPLKEVYKIVYKLKD